MQVKDLPKGRHNIFQKLDAPKINLFNIHFRIDKIIPKLSRTFARKPKVTL